MIPIFDDCDDEVKEVVTTSTDLFFSGDLESIVESTLTKMEKGEYNIPDHLIEEKKVKGGVEYWLKPSFIDIADPEKTFEYVRFKLSKKKKDVRMDFIEFGFVDGSYYTDYLECPLNIKFYELVSSDILFTLNAEKLNNSFMVDPNQPPKDFDDEEG